MKVNITFKKQTKSTGLARIGEGETIEMKIKKKRFGSISTANWNQNWEGWKISFAVKDGESRCALFDFLEEKGLTEDVTDLVKITNITQHMWNLANKKHPAYIHEDDDGTASGFFPGVPGCYFAGDTVEECLADARMALDAHLEFIADNGDSLPEPTSAKQYWHDEDCQGGVWVLVDIDATKFEGGAVRFNEVRKHRDLTP